MYVQIDVPIRLYYLSPDYWCLSCCPFLVVLLSIVCFVVRLMSCNTNPVTVQHGTRTTVYDLFFNSRVHVCVCVLCILDLSQASSTCIRLSVQFVLPVQEALSVCPKPMLSV
eukprot:scpid61382/ scgid24935/ 